MQWFNIYSDRKITSRIDTFSACTGEKPGRYLIPYFSGFCPAVEKGCNSNFLEDLKLAIEDFKAFQCEEPEKVKIPD